MGMKTRSEKGILFALLLLLLLAPLGGWAQPSVRMAAGPYLQAVGGDEFTVVWTTNIDAVSWVEIAPNDGSHFYAEQRPAFYQTRFGRRPIGTLHSVRVTGLKPGTTYRYRVFQQAVLLNEGKTRVLYGEGYGSDILSHKPYTATTLDAARERVAFAVVNDMHEHDSVFRELFRDAKQKYDFVCFNGDMTTCIDSEEDLFKHYLASASELFAAETPLYVARGNHENRGVYAIRYMDYFPSSSGCPYYAFRQGPAFFIVLDSGEDKPDSDIRNLNLMLSDRFREEEAEWLRGVVASPEFKAAPVKIVFCHMPPNPTGWHGSAEVSRLFVPILNRAGIDLMLSAHTHRYSLDEAGKRGCEFPVLCNPNLQKLTGEVTAGGIRIVISDATGAELKKLTFGRP